MKRAIPYPSTQHVLLILFMWMSSMSAQTSYRYSLKDNFREDSLATDSLTLWPNALGQTGQFVTRQLPTTTCPNGAFEGYAYEDNAGLRFEVPANFINCEYSIQFTWNYDNPGAAKEWIKILSFVHTDDSGINIWTQPSSTLGGLYYWHLTPWWFLPSFCPPEHGALSPVNIFNDTDYYQITFTRTCNNQFTAYLNGSYIGHYLDTDQHYFPSTGQIVFFRDTADTSCYPTPFPGEASSGFISDLVIANYVFSAAQIAADYQGFCPPAAVLPLAWSYMEAYAEEGGNSIRWAVNMPEQVARFVVERSDDGLDFYPLHEVSSQEVAESLSDDFQFLDASPVRSRHFYRVLAVDREGQQLLSELKEVVSEVAFRVYPNPARERVYVEVGEEMAGEWVEVIDMTGKVLQKQVLEAGKNQVNLQGFSTGLLLLKIGQERTIRLRKF